MITFSESKPVASETNESYVFSIFVKTPIPELKMHPISSKIPTF